MTLSLLTSPLRAVVFDVGETLVDESEAWSRLAVTVGVTPFTLMGVVGALIERGENHRNVWRILGVDAPEGSIITAANLYPDALPCLAALATAGYRVGIAGNQPSSTELELLTLGFKPDFIASSTSWGVAKPSPEFFTRVIDAAGVAAVEVLYVGDRVDNDIVPARSAGMRTAFIRRGPWGYLHAQLPEMALADITVSSLSELTDILVPTGSPQHG